MRNPGLASLLRLPLRDVDEVTARLIRNRARVELNALRAVAREAERFDPGLCCSPHGHVPECSFGRALARLRELEKDE